MRGRGAPVDEDEVCATYKGKLLAIGMIEKGQFKPKRVFTIGSLRLKNPAR